MSFKLWWRHSDLPAQQPYTLNSSLLPPHHQFPFRVSRILWPRVTTPAVGCMPISRRRAIVRVARNPADFRNKRHTHTAPGVHPIHQVRKARRYVPAFLPQHEDVVVFPQGYAPGKVPVGCGRFQWTGRGEWRSGAFCCWENEIYPKSFSAADATKA